MRVLRGTGLARYAARSYLLQLSQEISALLNGPCLQIGEEGKASEGVDETHHVLAIARPLVRIAEFQRDVRDLGGHETPRSGETHNTVLVVVASEKSNRLGRSDQ